MIIDERMVAFIQSLDKGNTPFLMRRRGNSHGCTNHSAGYAKPDAVSFEAT